uniref:Photosystem I assembly protein Ycf4 n=2 Tax=Alsophila TaxID=86337 RepID=C5HY65_9MONI|nr:photosystem I assembly protein ycf4 [Alsophila spinulosa]YP_009679416.1 photosystem I assembly protein Ycf4 [Alsophila costularis]ACK77223.1 photosystem I assembly protein ycf4 [Alsophila spinulosa]QDP70961.1 photosystem I assembly protein Ycf4 [Alsophila costularis]QUJ10110.1 photosystem I assembly protein Ycf4 [Alsophila latebrosa]
MTCHSKWIRVDPVKGSRTIANLCWACILVRGATGFLLVGISSCIGKDLIPGLSSEQIVFIPQGIVMCFYGIAGLFLGFYPWCTVFRNVGSGYNLFDKREGIFSIFRWGFPGRNRRICIRFVLKDVEAVGLEIREGLYPRRILYLRVRGRQNISLTRIGEDLTLGEMEEEAAELARFLRVSIEGF